MKRIVLFYLFVILSWYAAIAGSVHFTVKFSPTDLTFNEVVVGDSVFIEPQLAKCYNSGERIGQPSLPRTCLKFALPLCANNIRIENILTIAEAEHQLTYRVVPEQIPAITTDKNSPIYPGADYYEFNNAPCVKLTGEDTYHEITKVVSVDISPVEYNPQNSSVRLYSSISFEISYSESVDIPFNDVVSSSYYKDDLAFLRSVVVNPEVLTDVSKKTTKNFTLSKLSYRNEVINQDECLHGLPSYEYCIITTRALKPAFQRLVSLKKIHGLDAGIICMEDILEHPIFQRGDTISNIKDDAGCLRAYLHAAYHNGTRYALLGGKPPLVPIRYACASIYNCSRMSMLSEQELHEYMIPTDLYFSELDSNWNKDNDELYGERTDNLSFVTDLYVGRICCKNADEIKRYIDKLEIYELNPGGGDHSYLKRGFAHYSNDFYLPDSAKESNKTDYPAVIAAYLKQIHPEYTEWHQDQYNIKGKNIIDFLRNNHQGFWSLSSHGNPGGIKVTHNGDKVASYGVNALDNERVHLIAEEGNGLDKIDNYMYPNYFYSGACTVIPFDCPKLNDYGLYEDKYDVLSMNFGESFTLGKNYGGIACIANTRNGYRPRNFDFGKEIFCNLFNKWMSRDYFGVALAEAKWSFKGSDWETYYTKLTSNLLGDPSAQVWSEAPKSFQSVSLTRGNQYLSASIEWDTTRTAGYQDAGTMVVIEPAGKIHKTNINTYSSARIDSISPNSAVYIVGRGYLPSLCDLQYQNITFKKADYIYGNQVVTGTNVYPNREIGNVVFDANSEFTIDASSHVTMNSGTIIKSGTTLKILTPGICVLRGVKLENGATLEISAAAVVNYFADNTLDGTLVTTKYDKYDRYEPKYLRPVLAGSRQNQKKIAKSQYTPMFEIGKTWKYLLDDNCSVPELHQDDCDWMLRVDEKVEIDGKDHYLVRAYKRALDSSEYEAPRFYGYFREDTIAQQVWLNTAAMIERMEKLPVPLDPVMDYIFRDTPQTLLYDFKQPEKSEVARLSNSRIDTEGWIKIPFSAPWTFEDANGKTRNSATDGNLMIVEGIGLLPQMKKCGDNEWRISGTIVGEQITMIDCFSSGYFSSYLYEITEADGTVIYRDERVRPAGVERNVANSQASITLNGDLVTVTALTSIGRIEVINGRGINIRTFNCPDTHFSFTTKGYDAGIYIVSAGGVQQKIVLGGE